MRIASSYLIVFSILLASCAAEDSQSGPWDDVQELDSSGRPISNSYNQPMGDSYSQPVVEPFNDTEGEPWEDETTDRDYESQTSSGDNAISLYDTYSQIPNAPETTSLAFSVSDLDGDKAADLLVMNISGQAETEDFNSSISALSGADGSILWQKDYPGSLVYAMTAG
ncbi:MAG TPA: hypothetical protein PKG66_00415, partial [Methanothrix sp.]|nr:hypothetical protein [Methanothrix sp.]